MTETTTARGTTTAPTGSARPSLSDRLRTRREARTRRRDLERELAAYRTPGEINELLLLISREDSAEADEIRDILEHNLVDSARRAA